jgi:hypothetical protein
MHVCASDIQYLTEETLKETSAVKRLFLVLDLLGALAKQEA